MNDCFMGERQHILEAAQSYRRTHGASILRDFADLLAIPNTANHREDLRRNAEHIRDALAEREVDAELFELEGAVPVVYGERRVPGAQRTLLLYAHYDGQPAHPERWSKGPWTPTLYDDSIAEGGQPVDFPQPGGTIDPTWRLYGRSASDDKAPIGAVLAALDALRHADCPPRVNLKFLFEGEEESGSPHLPQYLEAHRDRLTADALLICDGPVHQSRRPQLFFGARGYASMELTVYGPARHLHSGHYGNWAPNPNMRLARLLASMKEEDGTVRIDGFYDSVEPLGPAEEKSLETIPDIDDVLRRELGLAETEKSNAPLMERLLLPSLNIRGLDGGAVGSEAENQIPTAAQASIDMRLVKGNHPKDMFERIEEHIRRQGYHVVLEEPDLDLRRQHPKIARVVRRAEYPAVRTAMDRPIIEEIARVAEAAAGEPVVRLPHLGGSLPLHVFEALGLPIVGVPIANYDNNQHGPDENLQVGNLWYGVDLFALLFATG